MIAEKSTFINKRPYNSKLQRIICGLNTTDKTEVIIKEYLTNLINFLEIGSTKYDVIIPEGFFPIETISDDGYGITSYKMKTKFEFLKNITFIESSEILINPYIKASEKQQISNFITKLLSSNYRGTRLYATNTTRNRPIFNQNDLKLFGNPEFIEWLIKNDNNFALSDEAINSSYTVKSLSKFEVIPASHSLNNASIEINTDFGCDWYESDSVIQLKPYFFEREFKFSNQIINKNRTNQMNAERLIVQKNHERELNSYDIRDSVNWSNWNDDLDADQQSPDFWNQF